MNEQTLSAERISAVMCNSIRTTDEISFQLMVLSAVTNVSSADNSSNQ
jgi:hypothetical protein